MSLTSLALAAGVDLVPPADGAYPVADIQILAFCPTQGSVLEGPFRELSIAWFPGAGHPGSALLPLAT